MATNPPTEPNGAEHAFIFDPASGQTIDAGILLDGAIGSWATGVNNSGTICGRSDIPCGKHCTIRRSFIWKDGLAQDLGVLPGSVDTYAEAINDSNVVVGFCASGGSQGFVWRNGVIMALDDLLPAEEGLTVDNVWDINNAGQIAGLATVLTTGDDVAVRLTPIPSPIGDSDCDSDVDVDDLLSVINHDASPKGSNALPPGDFDHDGIVELDDLTIVLDNWTF